MLNARLLEFIPILLACIAVVSCSLKFGNSRRFIDRVVNVGSAIAATLLIIAQTSFWALSLHPGAGFSTIVPDAIWTVFNSLVMIIFIVGSAPRK